MTIHAMLTAIRAMAEHMMFYSSRIFAMSLLVLSLAACSGGGDAVYEDDDALYDWVGESERALVLKWGAPDTVYALTDGNRVLTWRRSRTEKAGGGVYTVTEKRVVDGREELVPITRQAPVTIRRLECMTNIEIDADGYVTGYKSEGNDCRLPPPD